MYKVIIYNGEGNGVDVEKAQLQAEGLSDKFNIIRMDGDLDEEFFAEAADADGIIACYTQFDRARLSGLRRCKVIAVHAIGVNNIDLEAASELGIAICNTPTYCIEEVAVHTIAMMLDGARKLTQFDRKIQGGAWPSVSGCGRIYRTKGRTYGLVAFGNIPKRIAQLAQAFGMNVIAYDPFCKPIDFEKTGVRRADTLEELFQTSDYISVHTPLLPETKHMIGKAQFDVVRRGAIIVATGRGGVIDELALKDAINEGKISFAALDVIENEVTLAGSSDSPLMGMDEAIFTPHAAYYSEDSLIQCRSEAISQVCDVLERKIRPFAQVN
ncbi:MAG: C-terminal binding protein [Clostridiales Family XIII bacterium]|jgi:D-3-phosphoglycerate dehydrogenase|nr:C-terminal binding protein [Clostridiales Family XIII bacterium]